MAARLTKTQVKDLFATGDKPSQADFANFIDSTITPLMGIVTDVATLVATDAATADIFRITLTESVTLSNPTNVIDGQMITWWIAQDGTGGWDVTLDSKFDMPSSAAPLVWSTAANKMDMLAVRYDASADLFRVISFIPGYTIPLS